MPSKSRHSHRKKAFKAGRKGAPVTQATADEKSAAGEQVRPAVPARAASATMKAAPVALRHYPYIKKELGWIGILSVIIFIILAVLYIVL
jgi:hypothetical protein